MFRENIKQIIILIAAIIICAILARTLSGGETLSQYASKHPEIAYGSSESAADTNSSDNASSTSKSE